MPFYAIAPPPPPYPKGQFGGHKGHKIQIGQKSLLGYVMIVNVGLQPTVLPLL